MYIIQYGRKAVKKKKTHLISIIKSFSGIICACTRAPARTCTESRVGCVPTDSGACRADTGVGSLLSLILEYRTEGRGDGLGGLLSSSCDSGCAKVKEVGSDFGDHDYSRCGMLGKNFWRVFVKCFDWSLPVLMDGSRENRGSKKHVVNWN